MQSLVHACQCLSCMILNSFHLLMKYEEPDPKVDIVPLSNSFGCVWNRKESWKCDNYYALHTMLYDTKGKEIDRGTFLMPSRDDMPQAKNLTANTNYTITYWAVLDGSSFSNTTMQMATTSKCSFSHLHKKS